MLFFIVLAFVLLTIIGLASVVIPFIVLEDDAHRSNTRQAVYVIAAGILVFCVSITGIISLAEHLVGNGCASDETKITKHVGKSTISKCVPDSTLGFLFN